MPNSFWMPPLLPDMAVLQHHTQPLSSIIPSKQLPDARGGGSISKVLAQHQGSSNVWQFQTSAPFASMIFQREVVTHGAAQHPQMWVELAVQKQQLHWFTCKNAAMQLGNVQSICQAGRYYINFNANNNVTPLLPCRLIVVFIIFMMQTIFPP